LKIIGHGISDNNFESPCILLSPESGCLEAWVVSLSPPTMPEYYLTKGHNHFLPHPSQFMTCTHPNVQRHVTVAIAKQRTRPSSFIYCSPIPAVGPIYGFLYTVIKKTT